MSGRMIAAMLNRSLALPLLLLTLALLCACGPSGKHAAAQRRLDAQQQASAAARLNVAPELDPNMVAGVSQAGSEPPIGLKFLITERPQVGLPLQIELALIPSPDSAISHIHCSLQTGEGLQLQSARTFEINEPQAGVALKQDVTVVPQQEGVLSLSATLLIDLDNGSVARTYTIPLIATSHSS